MHHGAPRGERVTRALALLLIAAAALGIAAANVPGSLSAVHAGASTPEMPPYPGHVAVVDGVLFVEWAYRGTTWVSSTDGTHFSRVRVDNPPKLATEACVPSAPDTCYRFSPDGSLIEKSVDGGQTWVLERPWRTYSADDGFAIRSAAGESLAILEHDGSYQVFVGGGFAVRAADGTWSMVPDLGAVAAGVMDPPTFGTIGSATVVVAVGIGVVFFLLSLALLSLLARDRSDSEASLPAGYGAVAFAEAMVAVLLVIAKPQVVASKPPMARGFELSATTIGTVLVVVAASFVMTLRAGTAVPSRPQEQRRIVVSSALVGLAAGLARLLPWPTDPSSSSRGTEVAVTAVVALALAIALGLWREKRHRAGVRG
jgi:hypothetical protein